MHFKDAESIYVTDCKFPATFSAIDAISFAECTTLRFYICKHKVILDIHVTYTSYKAQPSTMSCYALRKMLVFRDADAELSMAANANANAGF